MSSISRSGARRWPAHLEQPPSLTGDVSQPVTRQDLFNRAASVETSADALDLYVLVCGWGTGMSARGTARVVRPLEQPSSVDALLRTLELVRTGHTLEAYRSLRGGQDRIKYFGPAFFTKWLYFGGYDAASSEDHKPLILDARVARALGWVRTWGWSISDYDAYLRLCHEIRDQWCPDESLHVIEYALFNRGGQQG